MLPLQETRGDDTKTVKDSMTLTGQERKGAIKEEYRKGDAAEKRIKGAKCEKIMW